MPEEKKADDVEKLLSEEKSLEDRKKALIDDPLKQREAAMAAFDGKLASSAFRPIRAREDGATTRRARRQQRMPGMPLRGQRPSL
jgi:hypothetical protein